MGSERRSWLSCSQLPRPRLQWLVLLVSAATDSTCARPRPTPRFKVPYPVEVPSRHPHVSSLTHYTNLLHTERSISLVSPITGRSRREAGVSIAGFAEPTWVDEEVRPSTAWSSWDPELAVETPSPQQVAALDAVQLLLAHRCPDASVGVVGSLRSGLAHDTSDVDLVVCTATQPIAAPLLGDPPLVVLLAGDKIHGVQMNSLKKKKKKKKPLANPKKSCSPTRILKMLKVVLENALREYGFVNPRWKKKGQLISMVHAETGITVDLWTDTEAPSTAETVAMRRVLATREAILRSPTGPLVTALYRMLRYAIGPELRLAEGSTYGPDGRGSARTLRCYWCGGTWSNRHRRTGHAGQTCFFHF
eukprot:m.330293 g.330293  ORF g.330293 m.330293 type:complete len:362 (-) comp27719_c0_seq14:491-1576(-)